MAFHKSLGNNNNNYQPQFFLSLNADEWEKWVEQKKHYENEKIKCEARLRELQKTFDELREIQTLIHEKHLVNVEQCCTLESHGKPIPPALAAQLEKSRALLEETSAQLAETAESTEEKTRKTEEALRSIEAELIIINKDLKTLQRSLSIVPMEEKIESLLNDILVTEQARWSLSF